MVPMKQILGEPVTVCAYPYLRLIIGVLLNLIGELIILGDDSGGTPIISGTYGYKSVKLGKNLQTDV